jgi:hypothetical protein
MITASVFSVGAITLTFFEARLAYSYSPIRSHLFHIPRRPVNIVGRVFVHPLFGFFNIVKYFPNVAGVVPPNNIDPVKLFIVLVAHPPPLFLTVSLAALLGQRLALPVPLSLLQLVHFL